jgi:NADH dehydrogenase FAD-containing subunit
LAGTNEYYARFRAEIAASKSVLVVGAGPVGLELAGELRAQAGKEVRVDLL